MVGEQWFFQNIKSLKSQRGSFNDTKFKDMKTLKNTAPLLEVNE